MARRPRAGAAGPWRVVSVAVRVRDGPERLTQAYRLLWDPSRPCRAPWGAPAEERTDADRRLRARLD
jgi:hypothetical protein